MTTNVAIRAEDVLEQTRRILAGAGEDPSTKPSPCCSTDHQAVCCEPSEKESCCGSTAAHGSGCGCQ